MGGPEGGAVTRREKLVLLWTVGEDLNWCGKLFVYTAGLPFLLLFSVMAMFEKGGIE